MPNFWRPICKSNKYFFFELISIIQTHSWGNWNKRCCRSSFLRWIPILVFGPFYWRCYENTKILCNLCLHFARQDGQDGKNRKKIKWPKYQKPKDENMGWNKEVKKQRPTPKIPQICSICQSAQEIIITNRFLPFLTHQNSIKNPRKKILKNSKRIPEKESWKNSKEPTNWPSLVNANLFYANFTKMYFKKFPSLFNI